VTVFREIPRSVRVVTGPLYEPVSRDLAKVWCRVDDDDTSQDAIVDLLLTAARERAEDITGRAFVERDLELLMDDLPDDQIIVLPYPPVQSVSYVRYVDTGGAEQELSGSPTPWILDTGSEPARLSPLQAASWPSTQGTISNVRIGFRCGHAPSGSPVDESAYQLNIAGRLKNWLAVRVSTFYEMRESIVVGGQVTEVPRDYVDGLLDGLIVHNRFA